MHKKGAWLLVPCALVLGLMAPEARADDPEHFKVYGGAAYVAPLADSPITFDTVTDTVQAQEKVGWNLGFEGRFNKLLGIEVDYVNATQDVDFGDTTIGEADFSPLTATLNFHLISAKHFDLYVGPSYSYVNWGEIHVSTSGGSLTGGSDIGTDSAHGWGASLGVDIGLGEHFAITGGLKYINVDLELEEGPAIEVNPLMGRLGVAFRF